MSLQSELRAEIEAMDEVEPNVRLFVDQSSIFWLSESGRYLWLSDHKGIDSYVDADHLIIDTPAVVSTNGVGPQGCLWMNGDFESPYHISDFLDRISTITL